MIRFPFPDNDDYLDRETDPPDEDTCQLVITKDCTNAADVTVSDGTREWKACVYCATQIERNQLGAKSA